MSALLTTIDCGLWTMDVGQTVKSHNDRVLGI